MTELITYAHLEGSTQNELKVCPISKVIEVSAAFAGIDVEDLRDSDEFCQFEELDFEERASVYPSIHRKKAYPNQCENIHRIINSRVRLVEEVNTFEELLSIDDIYNLPTSDEEKLRLFSELKPKKEKKSEAVKITNEWREIIYHLLGNEEEKNNDHFSGYRYEDLTDEVVLSEVKKFNAGLARVMLGKNRKEDNCFYDFSGL